MQPALEDIARAVQRIYREAVDPVGDRFAFEKRPSEGEIAGAPTVFFLGNHSSGKSTFINHILGAEVQKTGLAPTDDAFTILGHASAEEERDGHAISSNPDLPYGGLKNFGPEFLSHFRRKLRPVDLLREVTLIDSPGMIDSIQAGAGRGYDFAGAVRWFAERADVILVFFDPEKPGTTGETLQVFTQALRGMDHKILIVMNKMDQFRSLQDFARAYGALCWNLGKVIPRKDLPLIYTTFVPVDGAPPPVLPVGDFEKARSELIQEVRRAPARRVDNMLTQVADHVERLRMHLRIVDRAVRDLRAFRVKMWMMVALVVVFGGLAGYISILAGAAWWVSLIIFASAVAVGYGGSFLVRGMMKTEERQIVAGVPGMIDQLYAKELLVRDRVEDLRATWDNVHPRARQALERLGVLSMPQVRAYELARLDRAIQYEIPDLRSKLHSAAR